MQEDDPVKLDTRLAGQLKRFHTWPIIGQQTVAEHTWQMLRIYFSVVDHIDPHVVYYIQFHDIGEHATGDIPYPVKKDNPSLKEQTEILEEKSKYRQLEYWNAFHQAMLTPDDFKLVKLIELIEMAEFGLDQTLLGNKHGFIIANRCLFAAYESRPRLRLVQYVVRRLELFYLQRRLPLPETIEPWWNSLKWEEMYHDSE